MSTKGRTSPLQRLVAAILTSSLLLMGSAEKVRARMLSVLQGQGFSAIVLKSYAETTGILLSTEELTEWPESKLPADKEAMAALSRSIAAFVRENAPKTVQSAAMGQIQSVSDTAGTGPDLKKAARRKQPVYGLGRIDRLPPHAPEAEQGVLGCVLLSPNECLGQCVEKLKSGADAFYDLRHQTIYTALVEMHDTRTPIDIITLQQRLKDKHLLDEIGGIPYLNALQDSVPSAANLSYYLDIVEEKSLLRKMIHTCTDVVGRVYDYDGEVDALLDEVERDILAIRPKVESSASSKQLVHQAIDDIEARINNPGKIFGLETGLIDLDRQTDGLHKGEMIVIAARPSHGKSSLAIGIARHNALKKIPVAVCTAEMPPRQVMKWLIFSEAKANSRRILESDGPMLTSAAGRLSAAPIHIVSVSGKTIGQVQAILRRLKQEQGIQLFVIDYLQKLTGKGDNREQQIASVSAGIKSACLELDIPGIALSQVNKDGDVRESQAIAQDADSVWKLDNKDGKWEALIQPITLYIDKCRDGETGSVELVFQKTYTRFESAARVAPEDS